jgi:acyl carrier protein
LTAQRFGADPGLGGGRLYATGDVVLRNADGLLEFLGRGDSQVKVRGFRVELEELERRAQLIPGVAQATAFVLAQGNALGLAIRPSLADTSDADLRRLLGESLPEYLLPSRIIRRDNAFPTTATGKVDRDALAASCEASAGSAAASVPQRPSTPNEATVAGIWADLLGTPVTDYEASFFEIGGHSLLAAQLVSSLREVTGVNVSMRDLLAQPTVSALAAIVDRPTSDSEKYAS